MQNIHLLWLIIGIALTLLGFTWILDNLKVINVGVINNFYKWAESKNISKTKIGIIVLFIYILIFAMYVILY